MDRVSADEVIAAPLSRRASCIHTRIGHVSAVFEHYVLVWGGYCDRRELEGEQGVLRTTHYYPADQLLLYDTEYQLWHRVLTVGQLPPRLCGSTAAVCGRVLYVYGGFCEELDALGANVQTLYALDLDTMRWRLLSPAGLPPLPCDKLVSWSHAGRFYLFGGFGPWPDQVTGYTEVGVTFRIDGRAPDRRGWNNQLVAYLPAEDRWEWPAARGEPPPPRAAHAAALQAGRLYVFGGRLGQRLNDLYSLELETLRWQRHEAPAAGLTPQPRSWHSLTPLLPGQLLLYGGFSQQNQPLDDPWVLHVPPDPGQTVVRWEPAHRWLADCPRRMWHTACPTGPGQVLLVGGLETSIYQRTSSTYARDVVCVCRAPASLFHLCLDTVQVWSGPLLPLLGALPQHLLDRVMSRLTSGDAVS